MLNKNSESEKQAIAYIPLMEATIKTVVKHKLFHKVRFIWHDEFFHEVMNKRSIGKFIMDHCNIDDDEKTRTDFWGSYKQVVKKQVKIQRNFVHNALKK